MIIAQIKKFARNIKEMKDFEWKLTKNLLQIRYFPSRDDRGHSTIDLDSRNNRFPDPSEPIYTDPTLFEK